MTSDKANVTLQSDGHQAEVETGDEVPQWLRTLVIVLGVAIVMMTVLIVGTIIKRMMTEDSAPATSDDKAGIVSEGVAPALPAGGLAEITVERPAGAQLVYSQIVGREFLLHFKLQEGGDMIMAIDRMTGTVRRLRVPLNDGGRP